MIPESGCERTFRVDGFGWVVATGKDRGMLKTQSVEAHLLHAILLELKHMNDQRDWKEQHENLLEVRRQDLAAMQERIDTLKKENAMLEARKDKPQ